MWITSNLKKINFSHIPYIIIIILLIVVTCQSGKETIKIKEVIKRDTVTVIKKVIIHDTVPGKTVYIKGTPSTSWVNIGKWVPKPTYDSLLEQYKALGGLYFKKNVFSTRFDIENHGYVMVKDSISENWLNHSELQSFLTFTEKTVTVTEKELYKPKRQLYLGLILTGTKIEVMNSASVGLLYKDKKDRLFGGSIGMTSQGTQIGLQSYLKIKLRK